MVVHHRLDVGPRLVDLAVDEALAHRLARARVERIALEVVLDHVVLGDQLGRERARHEVAAGVAVGACADVAVGVDDAVLGEDAVRAGEIFDEAHPMLPFLGQSALMPAAFTTRDQRASSLFTRAPKRSGGPPPAFMPCFSSSARTSGCLSRAFSSALTLATTGAGVPAGANTPYQVSTSRSARPSSFIVGTSGNALERSALITESMRSLPLCT